MLWDPGRYEREKLNLVRKSDHRAWQEFSLLADWKSWGCLQESRVGQEVTEETLAESIWTVLLLMTCPRKETGQAVVVGSMQGKRGCFGFAEDLLEI